MRRFLHILPYFMAMVFFVACDKVQDYEDEIVRDVQGTWSIFESDESREAVGTVEFTADETFTMRTQRGDVEYGDYSPMLDDGYIAITWAEGPDGNSVYSDDEYADGVRCKIEFSETSKAVATGLPYYNGESVVLVKQ